MLPVVTVWSSSDDSAMCYVFLFCGHLHLLADLSPLAEVNACVHQADCGGIMHCSPMQHLWWTSAFVGMRGDGDKFCSF